MAGYWYTLMRGYGIESLLKISIIPMCYVLFLFSVPFIIVWFKERMFAEKHSVFTLFRIRLAGIVILALPIWGLWHLENKELFTSSEYIFAVNSKEIPIQSLTDWDIVKSYFNPPVKDTLLYCTQAKNEFTNFNEKRNEFNYVEATTKGIQVRSIWESTGITPMQEQSLTTAKNALNGLIFVGLIAGLVTFGGLYIVVRPKKFTISALTDIK